MIESLWSVEDRATDLLLDRFYKELFAPPQQISVAEALRRAKLWLREYRDSSGHQRYADPVFWAAFVLLGNPGS